jgi:hypothetical protein
MSAPTFPMAAAAEQAAAALAAAEQRGAKAAVAHLRSVIARAEAAEREVARLRGVWAQAEAAAHFAQSVAHLLASPGAEAEAVQHLRADDLPHLLDCLRGRLMLSATEPRWVRLRNEADLAAEAQPAEVADG